MSTTQPSSFGSIEDSVWQRLSIVCSRVCCYASPLILSCKSFVMSVCPVFVCPPLHLTCQTPQTLPPPPPHPSPPTPVSPSDTLPLPLTQCSAQRSQRQTHCHRGELLRNIWSGTDTQQIDPPHTNPPYMYTPRTYAHTQYMLYICAYTRARIHTRTHTRCTHSFPHTSE